MSGHCLTTLIRRDMEDGGGYQISGTVDELGVVGSYRVRLHDRISGRSIREIWAETDGSYLFDWIAYRVDGYYTIAFWSWAIDHGTNPQNAAVADYITPVIMS